MDHVLSAHQFNPEQLEDIFALADIMRDKAEKQARKLADVHAGCVAAMLFYEPSTRTRVSHETAALKLGIGVTGTENAGEFSSAIKGETLEDTIRTVSAYADLIVLRHPEIGAADRAATVSTVPIINAGDGAGEHPTQALLDLYTIRRKHGRLTDLNVVIGGDLKHGRTARSLALMMGKYSGNHITFVSTPELQIDTEIKKHLKQEGVSFTEIDNVFEAVTEADVVYWTRLQKERLKNPISGSNFVIDQAVLQAMPKNAIIMHPLPRVDEIAQTVDDDPRAVYFSDQVGNGLYVRMALMEMLLSSQ